MRGPDRSSLWQSVPIAQNSHVESVPPNDFFVGETRWRKYYPLPLHM